MLSAKKFKSSSKFFEQVALVLVLSAGTTAANAQTMLPAPDPSFAPPRSNYNWGGSVENDVFRKADKYTDAPQVDADGVRHFANGRHLDLSKMSVEDAVAETNASTLGAKQKPNANRPFRVAGNRNNAGSFADNFQNSGNNAGFYASTDWGGSQVAAMNNQNYRQQTNYWNGRRQRRNPRWNWN